MVPYLFLSAEYIEKLHFPSIVFLLTSEIKDVLNPPLDFGFSTSTEHVDD